MPTTTFGTNSSPMLCWTMAGASTGHSSSATQPRPAGQRTQTWHHSGRSECLLCHVWTGGSIMGFKLHQLDRPKAGDPAAPNQLDVFDEMGLFTKPLPRNLHHQVSPTDESASLMDRARAYLHLNCAHCHRSEGGGLANFNARQTPSLADTNLVNCPPMQGNFGIEGARIVCARTAGTFAAVFPHGQTGTRPHAAYRVARDRPLGTQVDQPLDSLA